MRGGSGSPVTDDMELLSVGHASNTKLGRVLDAEEDESDLTVERHNGWDFASWGVGDDVARGGAKKSKNLGLGRTLSGF